MYVSCARGEPQDRVHGRIGSALGTERRSIILTASQLVARATMSGEVAATWERREDGQSLHDHRADRAQNGDVWKQEHVAGRGDTADPYCSTKVA